MFASSVGIDRTVKENIGGLIVTDDSFRGIQRQAGPKQWQFIGKAPAVIHGFMDQGFVTTGRVAHRSTPLAGFPFHKHLQVPLDQTVMLPSTEYLNGL